MPMTYTLPSEGQGKEAVTKVTRRSFPVKEKLRVMTEYLLAQQQGGGAVGALMRREGLSSATLSRWKAEWDSGVLCPAKTGRRGPEKVPVNPLKKELEEANKRIEALEVLVRKRDLQIEFQKKIYEIVAASDAPRAMPSVP
jgi:transposase-like protein